jgi:hypothetical protein
MNMERVMIPGKGEEKIDFEAISDSDSMLGGNGDEAQNEEVE